MATLYKKSSGIYYLSVAAQGKRTTRSLSTRSYQIAKKVRTNVESELLQELLNGKKRKPELIRFEELVELYLNDKERPWSNSTRVRNRQLLHGYIEKGLPDNITTRSMAIRTVNACNRWGHKRGLIEKPQIIPGGNRWESRQRVFNEKELQTLFSKVIDNNFNQFVRFAYYTGARRGEISALKAKQVLLDYITVNGKSSVRVVKINSQARDILKQRDELWYYSTCFISHKFKKECRRLGISDARFHDLRRTFGYNLIKQGKPIYEVSKLLGHSSVTTTERHYAPLLTTEIDDFVL